MSDVVDNLVTLRTVVACLGEAHSYAWWDSNFLSETGLAYLQYNFPRTYHAAGVQGSAESAKRVHDERIGRAEVRHLFRLGNSVDKLMHETLMEKDREELLSHISSKESAMEALKKLAKRTVLAPEGPVQIGTEKDIVSNDGVVELAAHYLSGFEQECLVLPFFGAAQRNRTNEVSH